MAIGPYVKRDRQADVPSPAHMFRSLVSRKAGKEMLLAFRGFVHLDRIETATRELIDENS